MDSLFEKALAFVLKWEGGYVCNPDDRGGATNHGITQATYNQWRMDHSSRSIPEGVPAVQSVKIISPEEVQEIYKVRYWDPFAMDNLPGPLWIAVFNCGVNMGVSTAKRLLKLSGGNVEKFLALQEKQYRLYAQQAGQKKFLQGWLNRLDDLKKLLLSGKNPS